MASQDIADTNTGYTDIVGVATGAAAALGVPGALSFGLDIAGMAGVWIAMMAKIAQRARPGAAPLDSGTMTRLLVGVFASAGAYWTGSKILSGLIGWLLPGIGTGTAMTLNALFNGAYTWRLGHTMANLFERRDFDVTDIDTMREVLVAAMRPIPTTRELRMVRNLIRSK